MQALTLCRAVHHLSHNQQQPDDNDQQQQLPNVDEDLGQFEVFFECHEPLTEGDIGVKMLYLCNPSDYSTDQKLEHVQFGPLNVAGKFKFTLQGRAPDCTKIRPQDLLGVTLVILEFSFCDQIFANCGFILRNFYEDPELEANPPEVPQFKKIRREIIKSAKINCFNINWTQDTKLEESGQCKSNMRNSEDLQQAVNSSFKENCGNLFLEKKRLVDKEENKETTDDDNKIKNSSRQATLDSPSFF